MFLVRLVSVHGSDAVAGYTIAIRVIMFMILPAFGLSNAVATLVGQNLGARKPERARATVLQVARYTAGYMALVTLLIIANPAWVMGFFSTEPDVVASGMQSLRILSYGLVLLGVGVITVQSFNGAGDTMTPTWINLFCFWVVQIPLAWLLSTTLGLGPLGVYWSVLSSDMLFSVVATALFLRGSWQRKMI